MNAEIMNHKQLISLSFRRAFFPGMTVVQFSTATFPPGQVCEEKSPFGNNEILRSAQNDRGLSSHNHKS